MLVIKMQNRAKEVLIDIYGWSSTGDVYIPNILFYIKYYIDPSADKEISYEKSDTQIKNELMLLMEYLLDETQDFIGFQMLIKPHEEFLNFKDFKDFIEKNNIDILNEDDANWIGLIAKACMLSEQMTLKIHLAKEIPQYIKDIFELPPSNYDQKRGGVKIE